MEQEVAFVAMCVVLNLISTSTVSMASNRTILQNVVAGQENARCCVTIIRMACSKARFFSGEFYPCFLILRSYLFFLHTNSLDVEVVFYSCLVKR